MVDPEKLKDVATIIGALLSPFIGAAVAIWTYRRKEREILHGYVAWEYTQTRKDTMNVPS
jgi:hypothetical protein